MVTALHPDVLPEQERHPESVSRAFSIVYVRLEPLSGVPYARWATLARAVFSLRHLCFLHLMECKTLAVRNMAGTAVW